jgi:hypothetical protein
MDAEAVLKHRVRDEQTSGEKKSPSKGVIIFKFFPARTQIFRQVGQLAAGAKGLNFREGWGMVFDQVFLLSPLQWKVPELQKL